MSVVRKLLKKILKGMIYLEMQGLIKDNNFIFVRGKSQLANLIVFFEELIRLIKAGH